MGLSEVEARGLGGKKDGWRIEEVYLSGYGGFANSKCSISSHNPKRPSLSSTSNLSAGQRIGS